MWIRCWLAGVVFAMLAASSLVAGLMHAIVGKSEPYMFGSILDTIAPSVISASGVEQFLQVVLFTGVMGVLVLVGAAAWPMVERVVLTAAGVLSKATGRPR